MIDEKLIDLFYQNDSVEGVAVFSSAGQLIENQLALGESTLEKVGVSIARIRNDLSVAERQMFGFALKAEKILLQIIIHDEQIILLQLTPDSDLNEVYLKIVSALGKLGGSQSKKPTLPAPPESTPQQPAETAAAPEAAPGSLLWSDYEPVLLKLLKSVAPGGLAKKMLTDGAAEVGYSPDSGVLTLDEAALVGQAAVNKIPNAARRKIVMKEFASIHKKLAS